MRRHASANRVRVTLSYLEVTTLLDVVDDGQGFDPSSVSAGHGLSEMRARLDGVGGHLDVETEPDRATALAATIPLPPESDAHGR